MPPARRSFVPPQPPQEDGNTTVQNDELENARKSRRERVQSRRSLAETPAARANQTAVAHESVKERREHYIACMKLAQCNKIDSRNAFGLDLIDGLSSLIKNADEMNFGLATTALDAGTKIYVNRVDCVYSDAQKVSHGLVQTMQNKGKGRGDEDGQDDDSPMDEQDGPTDANPNDTAVPKQRKKAIVKRAGKTLASSIASLDIEKIATNAEIDPLFHKINTSHDIGNVNSMFLANLDLDLSGALVLDANSCTGILSSTQPALVSSCETIQSTDLCEKFKSFSEKPGRIFGDKFFLNFTFNRNASLEMTFLETTGRFEDTATQAHPSKYAFDLNAAPIECENFAPPDFNLSREGFDPSDDDDGDSDDENPNFLNKNKSIIIANNIEALGDLKSLLANSSEYSYFTKNINVLGSWAGPDHWKPNIWAKLRQRQEDRLRQGGQTDDEAPKKRAAKKKKEFEPVDFTSCPDRELSNRKKHASIQFKIDTLTRWKKAGETLTLPRSVDFDPIEAMMKMNLKPSSFYAFLDQGIPKSKGVSQESGHSVSQSSSPPPDTGFDVDDEIPFPPESQPIPEGFLPTQDVEMEGGFTGNNLIDAPDPLNQIILPYAKHAKRMDVKKLKKEMLELISAPASLDESLPTQASSPNDSSSILFKQLYSQLPSKLSSTMAKDMSPQIAFVTLLHLANENNLQLDSVAPSVDSLPIDIVIKREDDTISA